VRRSRTSRDPKDGAVRAREPPPRSANIMLEAEMIEGPASLESAGSGSVRSNNYHANPCSRPDRAGENTNGRGTEGGLTLRGNDGNYDSNRG